VAVNKELQQFHDHDTFGDASQEGRAMKTKLILKYSYNEDFSVKCKARLVVCGYSQIRGVDYFNTYSPTTNSYIVFLLFQISTIFNLHTAKFDIGAAFLEGRQDVKQFARLPPELFGPGEKPRRVEIKGNWYGTKQAAQIWNHKFDHILVEILGFTRCPMMPCLYYKFYQDGMIAITIHVDDGEVVSTHLHLIEEFFEELKRHVMEVKIFMEFNKFLGMIVTKNEDGSMFLSQEMYVEEAFKEYGSREYRTPMSNLSNLRVEPANCDNESLLPVTGKFRFLCDRTRPDFWL
jgi:hypothetical protein